MNAAINTLLILQTICSVENRPSYSQDGFVLDFFVSTIGEAWRVNSTQLANSTTFRPRTSSQLSAVNATPSSYVDIINNRKQYEEIRHSRTNDVNSTWSATFLAFFGLETLLIGSFIVFGILMFIVLQCKPKSHEKHVSLFD